MALLMTSYIISTKRNAKIRSNLESIDITYNKNDLHGLEKLLKLDTYSVNFLNDFKSIMNARNADGTRKYPVIKQLCSARWSLFYNMKKGWNYLLSTLDIKYRNCYQMRHTYASILLSNGENPAWIATQMGHVDVEMVFRVYGKWIPNNTEIGGYKLKGKY